MEFIEKDMWQHLKETNKPIFLYGMGKGAETIYAELTRRGIAVTGIFASDGFVRGHSFLGFPVVSYSQAKERYGDIIVLLSFGSSLPDVIANIKRIAAEQELYAPDVPVYGEGIFDLSYVREHKAELEQVYNALSDDLSRKTFKDVLLYRLTGKINYLFDCESSVAEGYELLQLGQHEVYVDLGAYRGETVTEFLEFAGAKKIIAVEPDEKTFLKLQNNLMDIPQAEAMHLAIHHKTEEVFFAMRGGRNSSIGAGKKGKWIQGDCLDRIAPDATYIKMDVEGEEANAILGGKTLIAENRPKMRISCYHRTEDIFALPLQVLALRSDYKVYLRHHPYLPYWDTEFYFA